VSSYKESSFSEEKEAKRLLFLVRPDAFGSAVEAGAWLRLRQE
jgi:hypothetical protein